MVPMKNSLAPSAQSVTLVTERDPKGLKFMSIVGAAYTKAGLTEAEAQRVNEAAGLTDLIAGFIAEHRNRVEFADEETESQFGYLSGYEKPLDVNAQCNKLRELFSGLGFCNQELLTQISNGKAQLPANAEGWFAIPNWKKNPKIFGSTYSEAVQTILNALNKARKEKFYNYRKGEIDEKHLRQSARSVEFWDNLAKAQGDADILIIAAQFGIRHRGRSVRRARVIMEDAGNEVGLGAFSAGAMLLTHPNRLQNVDDLWIDLSGDDWSPDGDGVFSGSLRFDFNGSLLEFGYGYLDIAYDCYGSGSLFLPQ